jgi:hypothetical protein
MTDFFNAAYLAARDAENAKIAEQVAQTLNVTDLSEVTESAEFAVKMTMVIDDETYEVTRLRASVTTFPFARADSDEGNDPYVVCDAYCHSLTKVGKRSKSERPQWRGLDADLAPTLLAFAKKAQVSA